jgi:hypothetical protein
MNSVIGKDFSSLWKTVLMAVENGRLHPPNVPKYQKNFILLIKDVMRNHLQLFTNKEISFIGSVVLLLKFIPILSSIMALNECFNQFSIIWYSGYLRCMTVEVKVLPISKSRGNFYTWVRFTKPQFG